MLKRKKNYTIKFRKAMTDYKAGTWKEITDSALLSALETCKVKYDFDIVSTKFQDSFKHCAITIKCSKGEHYFIFLHFVQMLGNRIEDISF